MAYDVNHLLTVGAAKQIHDNLKSAIDNASYTPLLTEKDGYYAGGDGYKQSGSFVAFEKISLYSAVRAISITCSFYVKAGVAFFDADGSVVLSVNGNNASDYGLSNTSTPQSFSINVPNNAKYVAGSIYKNDYTDVSDFNLKLIIGIDGILTSVNRYCSLTDMLVSKWFTGKKIVTQGDSLTANGHNATDEINRGYWQQILHDILGSTIINIGVGGTTVANNGQPSTQNGYNITDSWMCSNERTNMIPSDTDLVLFWGGHNDWGGSVPIGTVGQSTPDDTTFAGALQIALTKMIARVPNATIIFITPHVSRPDNANANVLAKNSLGLTMLDYAQAVKDVSEYYGFPCISMSDSGISVLNHTKYCTDLIHINSGEGAKAVASAVINGLVRYMPVR